MQITGCAGSDVRFQSELFPMPDSYASTESSSSRSSSSISSLASDPVGADVESGSPEAATTSAKATSVAIDVIPAVDIVSKPYEILTAGYLTNGGILVTGTALQAIVNRICNNNNFSGAAEEGSTELMRDMAFAHFLNKILKGNWTDVDSEAKQVLVLLANIAMATACDAAAFMIPSSGEQPFFIGQATAVAVVNSLGYFSTMAASKILGKKLFTIGPDAAPPKVKKVKGAKKSQQKTPPTDLNKRRVASGALMLTVAGGAAAANRLIIGAGGALGVVLNMACSEVVNKIFKAGQATEEGLANKVKLLAFYWFSSIAADVVMGLVLPAPIPLSSVWRYIGATSIGATMSFAKVTAKAALDVVPEEPPKAAGEATHLLAEPQNQAPADEGRATTCKTIGSAIATLVTPILTLAAYGSSAITNSATLSYATKLLQHNITSLAARGLFQAALGSLQRACAAITPVVIGATVELTARAAGVQGTGFPIIGVAVATSAGFAGMTVSDMCVRGNGDTDDG